DDVAVPPTGFDLADVGLNLFLPHSAEAAFAGTTWIFRGDNLCAWERGLRRPLRDGEIVIDARIGRVMFGVHDAAQRDALIAPQRPGFVARIYASYTYGAAGPVGAHPLARTPLEIDGVDLRPVSALPGGTSLQTQLDNLAAATQPVVVEIRDSLVHRLDLAAIPGTGIDGG